MKFQSVYYSGAQNRSEAAQTTISVQGLSIETQSGEHIHWKHEEIIRLEQVHLHYQFKYGKTFPFDTLRTDDEKVVAHIRRIRPDLNYIDAPAKLRHNRSFRTIALVLLLIVLAIGGFLFWFIPYLTTKVIDYIPRDQEISIGRQLKQAYLAQEHIDSGNTVLVNKFYHQLNLPTDYPIHITVVKSDVVNAFALPGGEIVIYTALLDKMNKYPELVALIGHEVGHVQHRHSLKDLVKNTSGFLILSWVFQDFGSLSTLLTERVNQLSQLSYSRDAETESDVFGFEVLQNNKCDTEGMVALFETLQEASEGTSKAPEFLQTHPDIENRIAHVRMLQEKSTSVVLAHDSLDFYFKAMKNTAAMY
jgi:Zn-dependent protease with chaperone function